MITEKGFAVVTKLLKANYNMADFPDDTLSIWFEVMKEGGYDDDIMIKAMKKIIATQPKWYASGTGLPASLYEKIEEIRQDMRYQIDTSPIKQLPQSQEQTDKEIAEQKEFRRKLYAVLDRMPHVDGESSQVRIDRAEREVKG